MTPFVEIPLDQRMPINGCIPMTPYEFMHTPPECRTALECQNHFLLLTENCSQTICPVILTDAGNIRVRA